MNKEDILARSRKEMADEGLRDAENKGRRLGITAFCGVFIFVVMFNLYQGQSSYAPFAMFWAFLAAESYPKYRFSRNKTYLVTTFAGAIASACYLVSYVPEVIR